MRRGSFPVNKKRFKEDPDREAVRTTREWIKEIRREGHISEIIEVVYDGDNNITGLVKELENAPLED
jgi:hypothetical protein